MGTWARAERDLLAGEARRIGAATELHVLDVPVNELHRRLQERNAEDPPITFEDLERYSAIFECPTADEIEHYDRFVHVT